jgi:hypothetical protein
MAMAMAMALAIRCDQKRLPFECLRGNCSSLGRRRLRAPCRYMYLLVFASLFPFLSLHHTTFTSGMSTLHASSALPGQGNVLTVLQDTTYHNSVIKHLNNTVSTSTPFVTWTFLLTCLADHVNHRYVPLSPTSFPHRVTPRFGLLGFPPFPKQSSCFVQLPFPLHKSACEHTTETSTALNISSIQLSSTCPTICTQCLATTPTRHMLTMNTDNSGSHAQPWAPTLTTPSTSGLLPPPSPTTSRTDLLDPTPSSALIVVNIYENLTILLAPSPADNTPTATAPASAAVTQTSRPWWEGGAGYALSQTLVAVGLLFVIAT